MDPMQAVYMSQVALGSSPTHAQSSMYFQNLTEDGYLTAGISKLQKRIPPSSKLS